MKFKERQAPLDLGPIMSAIRLYTFANYDKVADVAILAGVGRRIPVFAIAALEFINGRLR